MKVMRKAFLILSASLLAIAGLSSCDTKIEALDIQPAFQYTEAYYSALRAYKESDHSICYIWFADYTPSATQLPASPAFRFSAIPDSVDVVSLWGGIPDAGTPNDIEMRQMREKKGTRIVGVKIIRLAHNNYLPSWPKEAMVPAFYGGAFEDDYTGDYTAGTHDEAYIMSTRPSGDPVEKGYRETYEDVYAEEMAKEGATPESAAKVAETAAFAAGTRALIKDMQLHPGTPAEGEPAYNEAGYKYPSWCQAAAGSIMKEINDNDLDGYDLDYEPEGDALSGACMTTFVYYLSQFIGPASPNPRTILAVDGNSPGTEVAPLCSYWIAQSYGQTLGEGSFNKPGWKNSQLIFTENIGDYYRDGGKMEQQAAFQPSKGGRKGGFGAFHAQRDYNTTESGTTDGKTVPYGHLRRAIQLQNPAVTK